MWGQRLSVLAASSSRLAPSAMSAVTPAHISRRCGMPSASTGSTMAWSRRVKLSIALTLANKTVNGHNRFVVQILRREVATQDKQSAKVGDSATDLTQSLRERAESAQGHLADSSPEQFSALSPAEAQQVLHELRVHQIELKMQNDEWRRKQAELDTSNARYFDFYDLAPVGYCTLSEMGVILQANLRTAAMLGATREDLNRQALSNFILANDQIG